MAEQNLTAEDVTRLLRDPSGEVRAETARKVALHYGASDLSEAERHVAEDIFRLMIRDAEVRVRQSLALNLKDNPQVPRDVAMTLVRDVNTVALPMIEFSQVLTANDLKQIVREHAPDRLKAVARRDGLQDDVAAALVEEGTADIAATLAANASADMSEQTMMSMVERFGDDPHVQQPLVHRAQLPVTVSERLVHRVSEALKDHLLRHHELPTDVTADLVMQSRERAVMTLSNESNEDDVERLVRQLGENKRLTASLVLRAACIGDMNFLEYSFAELAGLPIVSTRELLHDRGPLGLKGLYQKAGLPDALFPAMRAAVEVANKTEYDGGDNDRERYQRRVLERVLTQYGNMGVDFEGHDLEYLLAKMNQMPALRVKP